MSNYKPGTGVTGRPILYRTSLHNTISDVMKNRGWREAESENDWDFFWADVGWMREFFDTTRFEEYQRVNHFRNHYELTRKDLLMKNLKRVKRQLEREGNEVEAQHYAFYPETYVLPSDYALFLEQFRKCPGIVWIMKPIAKAQGKGIFLFNRLSQISEWKRDHRWRAENPQAETYIVQRYVETPFLIGGRKFDLRIYALVTSYSPLKVWLNRMGFARFSNSRFTMDLDDLENTYIHLTNVAVQKTADNYNRDVGCKWSLRDVKLYMISLYGVDAISELFEEIQDVVIRSLLSVQKSMINDKHCFELYGYDILIDDALKPWLIEVNASPSLTADTQEDYDMKFSLLHDTLTIVDMEHELSGNDERVGSFDLVYHNGKVKSHPDSVYTTFLGCDSDRIRQLQQLSKKHQHDKKEEQNTHQMNSGHTSHFRM